MSLCRLLIICGSAIVLASEVQVQAGSLINEEIRNLTISDSLTMHWELSSEGIFVYLQTDPSLRWVAAAIGEEGSGSMPGMDSVLVYNQDDDWIVEDGYAVGYTLPSRDKKQDWILHSVEEDEDMRVFKLYRDYDTGDEFYDRPLDPEAKLSIPMLFACGTGAVSYHGSNRWRLTVDLFDDKNPVEELLNMPDYDSTYSALNPNVEIPAAKTTYHEQFIFENGDDFKAALGGRTLIGIVPTIQNATKQFVHHFTLYAITDEENMYGGDLIYAGASSASPEVFPINVGISADDYINLRLQTHFDNPNLVEGAVDNSGVILYLTEAGVAREHNLAVFQIGDPNVELFGQHLIEPMSRYVFECEALNTTDPVTFYTRLQHMHGHGAKIQTEIYRDGELVRMDSVEFYDFQYQDSTWMNWTALPGDRLVLECEYDNVKDVVWGLDSDNEMCIDFISAYPRSNFNSLYCGYKSGGVFVEEAKLSSIRRSFGSGKTKSSTMPHIAIIAGGVSAGVVVLVAAVGIMLRRRRAKYVAVP
eukprot:m.335073 g.335073  ORF g.335073 m.335073 type:complete len:531 (-) comp17509_c0_seq1:1350-2942(-)